MPAGIMLMGITFNLLNGYMQGEWIFYLAPQDMYTKSWLHSPQFIVGTPQKAWRHEPLSA